MNRKAAHLRNDKESAIRGPGLRLNHDVRRAWQCPQCGRTRKASGDVVSLRCGCTDGGVWMQLVSEPKPGRGNRPHPPDAHIPPDAMDIPPPPGLERNSPPPVPPGMPEVPDAPPV